MERIICAVREIRKKYPDTSADLVFRHYTLYEPSVTTLDKLEQFSPDDNGMFVSNTVLEEFGITTVLTTWLVRDGYGFTAPVEAVDFAGYIGYYIGKHLYLIKQDLSNEAIAAITEKYETDGTFNPENVVLFGYSFTWTEMESLKINLARLKDTEKNLRINFDIRYKGGQAIWN
jgi:type III restriction enzyme/adenine-specific DNA-methyltransferase